jgi:peptidoglycan/xylan/chitin deacetylase (PgdA/CDA1 family)
VTGQPLKHPPILTYHTVEELDTGGGGAALFGRQMEHLARTGYRSLSSREFADAVSSGEWPPKSVLITFDDGYLDFRTHAFPVLRELGFCATVFLISDALDLGPEGWAGPRPEYKAPLMGWSEVREMCGRGVSFGSHGVSHRRLSQLPAQDLVREVEASRRVLEAGLEEEIALFAYPYGGCDDAARAAVEAAGYSAGLGLRPSSPERFEIPRREVPPSEKMLPFSLRVSPAYTALSRLSHLVRRRP